MKQPQEDQSPIIDLILRKTFDSSEDDETHTTIDTDFDFDSDYESDDEAPEDANMSIGKIQQRHHRLEDRMDSILIELDKRRKIRRRKGILLDNDSLHLTRKAFQQSVEDDKESDSEEEDGDISDLRQEAVLVSNEEKHSSDDDEDDYFIDLSEEVRKLEQLFQSKRKQRKHMRPRDLFEVDSLHLSRERVNGTVYKMPS